MSSTVPAKMTTFFPSPPHREGAALPQEHAQSAVESSMANARMATAIPTSLTGISIKKRRGFLKRRRRRVVSQSVLPNVGIKVGRGE